jgi:hypothetical protein
MITVEFNIPDWLMPDRGRILEALRGYLKALAKWTIRYTITDYLTDPGRPWQRRVVRRLRTERTYERTPDGQVVERVRTYEVGSVRWVPVYPREKIGVVTGRLRASIGANWQGDEMGGGHYAEILGTDSVEVQIGTNVKYAEALIRRKYDYMALGLQAAMERHGEAEAQRMLTQLLGGG